MAVIQYPESGVHVINIYAEDSCGNRKDDTRTVNVRNPQHTISFNTLGGSAVTPIQVEGGTTATNFPVPTKGGYAFGGWFDNDEGTGNPITEIVNVQQDYTLYAKWIEESYGTHIFGSTNQVLAINLPDSLKEQYKAQYGSIYKSVPAWSVDNEYSYTSSSKVPWAARVGNIQKIVIGSPIAPNDMSYWFYAFSVVNTIEGFDNIDTSRCTKMVSTFEDFRSSTLTLDLNGWDVSNVTDFTKTFDDAWVKGINVSNWNTASATTMFCTFNMTRLLTDTTLDLSGWDFSNVTTMNHMFADSRLTKVIFNNPDTSKVTDFYVVFSGSQVVTIESEDWDFTSMTGTNALFNGCMNLVGGNGTAYNMSNVGKSYAVVDKEGRPGYFTKAELQLYASYDADTFHLHIFQAPVGTYTDGQVIGNMKYLVVDPSQEFEWSRVYNTQVGGVQVGSTCKRITTDGQPLVIPDASYMCAYGSVETIDLTGVQITGSASGMFDHTRNLQSLTVSQDWLDPNSTHNINEIFNNTALPQTDLQDVLDLCYLIDATSASRAFYNCTQLRAIDLRRIKMANATWAGEMFSNCSSLRTITVDPMHGWEHISQTPNLGNDMFVECRNLVGGAGTGWGNNHVDGEYCRIDNPPDAPGYLTAMS